MTTYVPKQGDIIAITFDPQSGHEQKGRRPALVISKDLFNKSTGLAIVCPVTNTERGFPFHVPIPKDSKLTGFIMVEQVKSVDFRARRVKRIERGNDDLLSEVLSILLYQEAFLSSKFGYGTAIAVTLFVIVLFISVILQRLMRRETLEY